MFDSRLNLREATESDKLLKKIADLENALIERTSNVLKNTDLLHEF